MAQTIENFKRLMAYKHMIPQNEERSAELYLAYRQTLHELGQVPPEATVSACKQALSRVEQAHQELVDSFVSKFSR